MKRPALREALGWGLLASLLAYAALIHHGVGPVPDFGSRSWWAPRGFLLRSPSFLHLLRRPPLAAAALGLPPLLLLTGVFAGTRSAVARLLAVTAVLSTALFLFYGLRAPGPEIWSFFGWRGSAVMIALALSVAAAATAPLLAASWLRRGWLPRVALYLPVLLAVVALSRNVTGTDPSLPFAVSPWPVVPVFGFGIGAYTLVGLLIGMAAGLAALSFARRRPFLASVGVGLALAAPGLWVTARLPLDAHLAVALALCVGLALATGATWGVREGDRVLHRRAGHIALGALLAGSPLLFGQWLARDDYQVTRNQRGQELIDAIGRFYTQLGEYPENLEQLVDSGELPALVRPRIGFALFSPQQSFAYQNFGSGYLLEFDAPGWVQCQYSPPWEEEEPETKKPSDGGLPEAWSCPSRPPDLW